MHHLQVPLYLVGFTFAFLYQAPFSVVAAVLFVELLLAPFHDLSTKRRVEEYAFWRSVALALGAAVGGLLVHVINAPPFIRARDFRLDSDVWVRTALLSAALVGAILWWALFPHAWINWVVACMIYTLVIVLSAIFYRVGRRMTVSGSTVFVVHFWWFAFMLMAAAPMGALQSALPYRWAPVYIAGVAGLLLLLLVLLNATFSNTFPRAPKTPLASDQLSDLIDEMTSIDARQAFEMAVAVHDSLPMAPGGALPPASVWSAQSCAAEGR